MTISIKHQKNTGLLPDWTQTVLDDVIAGVAPPLPPSGTLISNIVLPSDFAADHVIDTAGASDGDVLTVVSGAAEWATPGGGGSSAFNDITNGTNTTAAMVVGTGASLSASGSGTIVATSVPAAGIGAGTASISISGNAATVTTNANLTGDVTSVGNTSTVDKTAITGKTAVTPVGADYILLSDTSDSGNLKRALISDLPGGGGGASWGGITGDIEDQTDLTSYVIAMAVAL